MTYVSAHEYLLQYPELVVFVDLGGSIFSDAAQQTRNSVEKWVIEHNQYEAFQYSCYTGNRSLEEIIEQRECVISSLKYIAFPFRNARVAALFKLTFG